MNNVCIILIVILLIIYLIVRYTNNSFYVNNNTPLCLFWHIGSLTGRKSRLDEILTRQWKLIKKTGLYDHLSNIFVGIVGEESYPTILKDILDDPAVSIILPKDTKISVHECYTTYYLWKYCKTNPKCNIVYIHSRGVTHPSGQPTDEWTKMMEYFIIEKWKTNLKFISSYMTIGCDMWQSPTIFRHYPGNFWWAKASYINRILIDPYEYASEGTHRHRCGEFWILLDPNFNVKEHYIPWRVNLSLPTLMQPNYDTYREHLPPSKYRFRN